MRINFIFKFSWPVSIGLIFIILNFIFLLLETKCNLKFKQDLLILSWKKQNYHGVQVEHAIIIEYYLVKKKV